jgi:nucleoside-diphosphate-sugar epimerase
VTNYLITGGTGFIGSALGKSLLHDGHTVTVLDNGSRGRASRLSPYAGYGMLNLVKGDVRNSYDVWRSMQGVETVIHLAYVQGTQTFYSHPKDVIEVAYKGILNVLEAMESLGIRDLIMMSSSEAYQVADKTPTDETVPLQVPDVLNPRYSYGGGKIACELASQAYLEAGLLDRLIIPRPHNVYGPDMGREHVVPEFALRMNKLVKEQDEGVIPFPIQGTGDETRSFCFVDDFTAQMKLLLKPETPSGIYHLGTQDEMSIRMVAHWVASCYGRMIHVVPGKLPKGSPPRRCPDISKITELGWKPEDRVSFPEGIKRAVEWYQEPDNG